MSFLIGLFIVFAVLCLGYYLTAASYAGFGASFLGFWLVLAMLLLLAAVVLIFHKKYQILFLNSVAREGFALAKELVFGN